MLFQLADLFCQRLDGAQAPPGRHPKQRDHQQQVGNQHIDKPAPDHIRAFQLDRNGVDHHDAQLRQLIGCRVDIDRHRVGHFGTIILLAKSVQLLLELMIVAQQHATAVNVGLDFVEAVSFQPFRLNAFCQPADIALHPQQFAFGIVYQRHRRALHVEVFGDIHVDMVVFPLCQHIEQVTFAAQQAEGGFIKADAVAHQRNHAVGQRQHQHHSRRRQQKTHA